MSNVKITVGKARQPEKIGCRRGVAVYAFSAVYSPEAIRRQVRECEAFARLKFSGKPAVFLDTGVSGLAPDRKGRNALMREIEAGRIDVIVMRDIERISRDISQAAEFCRRAAACGAKLHFIFGTGWTKPVASLLQDAK
jgi:DNA invertase Pin-like site-specific DNA recombinase